MEEFMVSDVAGGHTSSNTSRAGCSASNSCWTCLPKKIKSSIPLDMYGLEEPDAAPLQASRVGRVGTKPSAPALTTPKTNEQQKVLEKPQKEQRKGNVPKTASHSLKTAGHSKENIRLGQQASGVY